MLKGLIVYFDGPDGVGKTTQLQMAEEALRVAGHEVYSTHVLAGSQIGEILQQAMLIKSERPPETDLHIALASQYAMLRDILARRNNQQIVLIDRSPLSIIAYQVFAGGLDYEKGYREAIEMLSKVQPDLLLFYDASMTTLMSRRQSRNHQQDNYFEAKPPTYHEDTLKGYREAANRLGAATLDGELSVEELHQITLERIMSLLKA